MLECGIIDKIVLFIEAQQMAPPQVGMAKGNPINLEKEELPVPERKIKLPPETVSKSK